MAEVYFRFIRGAVANVDDFRSAGALGKSKQRPGNQRQWDEGVSVYDNFDAACEFAASIRFGPGSFIVPILLPLGHNHEVVQTGRNPHHYTIYAAAEVLMTYVGDEPTRIPGSPDPED